MLRLHYNITHCVLFIISVGQGYCETCLYTTTGTEQEITFPAQARGNVDLVVKAPDGYLILLNITAIDQSCCPHVRVMDKNNSSLGIFGCGSDKYNLIVSNSEMLRIHFATVQNTVCCEFRALYKHVPCGGTYITWVQQGDKSLCSPQFPQNSDQSQDCVYLLYGEVYYKFQMLVDLRTADDQNYLEITEDNNEPIRLQGTLVSHKMDFPSAILKLRYRASRTNTGAGFRITYKLVQKPCEHSMMAGRLYKEFFSPGYPNSYPMFYQCTWTITPPEGFQVVLLLRRLDTDPNCAYLEVFDGENSLGRFSSTIPTDIGFSSSASNPLRVHFMSYRRFKPRRGFAAIYRRGYNCGNDIILSSNGTMISTPGYPVQKYPKSSGCSWSIRARKSMQIKVEVLNVETEQCCDFIQILDNTSPVTRLRGTYNTPRTFLSTSNVMRVYFHSDEGTEKRGFIAHVFEVCERTFYATSVDKYMESPNYSTFSPHNLDCEYKFVAPSENSTIEITIINFNTEPCCDYVQLTLEESSHTFRGYLKDVQIPIMQNTVTLLYHTDSQVNSKGFQIRYRAL